MTVVRAYVAVTDDDWSRFLAARPEMTEVNFWQPSGGHEFRVLAPGEPFFFKTHYPHNKLVGGGFSATRRGCGSPRRGSSSARPMGPQT